MQGSADLCSLHVLNLFRNIGITLFIFKANISHVSSQEVKTCNSLLKELLFWLFLLYSSGFLFNFRATFQMRHLSVRCLQTFPLKAKLVDGKLFEPQAIIKGAVLIAGNFNSCSRQMLSKKRIRRSSRSGQKLLLTIHGNNYSQLFRRFRKEGWRDQNRRKTSPNPNRR